MTAAAPVSVAHRPPAPTPLPGVAWAWHAWAGLPTGVLHDLLRLRSDVFIVEQACAYADIDGRDPACEHLVGTGPGGETLVCLRLLPPGVRYAQASLGRLATAAGARGQGLAREAVRRGLARVATLFPEAGVRISGQRYLQAFYEQFGFVAVDAPYDEDGIPHQDLRLAPRRVAGFGASAPAGSAGRPG